jgi:ankyrin repeat protein
MSIALLEGGSVIERHLTENASLFPSTQDASDRLQILKQLSDVRIDCETEGERSGVSSYYNSIANEAHQIAKTQYERALADVVTARSQSLAPQQQSGSLTALISSEWSIMAKAYAAPDPTDLERRDQHDKTPLMSAAEAGSVTQVAELLSRGANPNRTRRENDLLAGDSALTLAMQRYARSTGPGARPATGDYLGVVAALLHHPLMNPNLRDRRLDYTPLMKALERGQDEIVALLLEAGADPNLTAYQKQFSPLRIATARAMTGQSSAGVPLAGAMHQFHLLLAAKGINLDMTTRYDGQTALIAALGLAKTSLVRDLLTAGADPNAPDAGKRMPLIVITQDAILNPTHPDYVETFELIAGWPGVHTDTAIEGKTALQLCQESGRADLVAILAKNK